MERQWSQKKPWEPSRATVWVFCLLLFPPLLRVGFGPMSLIGFARHGFHESLLPRHDETYDKLDASSKERIDRVARNQRLVAVSVAVACTLAYIAAVVILLLRVLARTAGAFDFLLLAAAAAILVASFVFADKPLMRVDGGRYTYHSPSSADFCESVVCA